jgi:hypothetical protein
MNTATEEPQTLQQRLTATILQAGIGWNQIADDAVAVGIAMAAFPDERTLSARLVVLRLRHSSRRTDIT